MLGVREGAGTWWGKERTSTGSTTKGTSWEVDAVGRKVGRVHTDFHLAAETRTLKTLREKMNPQLFRKVISLSQAL